MTADELWRYSEAGHAKCVVNGCPEPSVGLFMWPNNWTMVNLCGGHRHMLGADPFRAPGTDDEPWTVPDPDPPADRRPFALAVLIIALAVVAIAWWPRP